MGLELFVLNAWGKLSGIESRIGLLEDGSVGVISEKRRDVYADFNPKIAGVNATVSHGPRGAKTVLRVGAFEAGRVSAVHAQLTRQLGRFFFSLGRGRQQVPGADNDVVTKSVGAGMRFKHSEFSVSVYSAETSDGRDKLDGALLNWRWLYDG